MKYKALATDFDGTLAFDGVVDDETTYALKGARQQGLRLILVTGRELSDLFNTFSEVHLFDLVVAENGAVLHIPADGNVEVLAPGPPPAFVAALQRAGIPLSVGHCIVATVIPHEHFVLQAIRDLGLEWHVIFNKEAVMALPSGVTKATGLEAALRALNLSPKDTVGIGDAQNDHSFLQACGLSVAVQNALPSLKEDVHLITNAERGAGVRELLDHLLAGDLESEDSQSDLRNSTRSAF